MDSVSGIIYKGKLKLDLYHKGRYRYSKFLHNAGTYQLFNTLVKLLIKGSSSSSDVTIDATLLPCFIDIIRTSYNLDTSTEGLSYSNYESLLTAPIVVSKGTFINTSKPTAYFKVTASSTNFNSKNTGSSASPYTYIVLKDATNDENGNHNILAYILLNTDGYYTIGDGDVHILTWYMTFENA